MKAGSVVKTAIAEIGMQIEKAMAKYSISGLVGELKRQ